MEIEGYENYLIYRDGKVQNKKTKRYLKPWNTGYLYVNLWKDGNHKKYLIHRLVAEHYIPNPDNKPCVDHINRDKKDNRVENLRWATHCENSQNLGVYKNNTSGIKNISHCKGKDLYEYKKVIRGLKHRKWFKTLQEAIEYKNNFESP